MLAMQIPQASIQFPEKLEFLFQPARYKVTYGGRGGAKSWGIARALLLQGASKPLRILCAREFQKSISESVHQLLKDQIDALGLSRFYSVKETYIEGKNGTLFTFHGLKHNIQNIKSLEGTDVCWVEEAHTVSKKSWDTLIPTVRKASSEIWVSFNPELESDETYQRFVVKPPKGAQVVKINWRDNPWFPDVLKDEKETLRSRSEDDYLHVYEGHTKQMLEGTIFADELRAATNDGRFTRVPYDASKPVDTIWDLGKRDMTAIWFRQRIGFEVRFIDYYENRGKVLSHYLKTLSEKPYAYGSHWLPHDADNDLLASELTIRQQVAQKYDAVKITPSLTLVDGINAARTLFSKCWFDAEKCADGINALRHYRYEYDEETRLYSKTPLHDWASHGADAFRYAAITDEEPDKPRKDRAPPAGGWMG